MAKLTEADLKSEDAKSVWRLFADNHHHIEDFSLGALLRLDASEDYSESNTIISIKIQFLAIEIARNREGVNDEIRGKFKPVARKPRAVASELPTNTRGGVVMSEIEHELQQIIGGQHHLMS